MKAPFPYFGGKSRVAAEVWKRFGDPKNYVEPFAGSLAVLLSRPTAPKIETINDADCYLSNFWRSVQAAPEEVAEWANWPVNEADLSARHLWLLQYRPLRVQADPDYYDAKIAGWWLWGVCAWIGSGFCSGKGPWQSIDGELSDVRKLPHLGNAGLGINRKLPHLGDAGRGINRQLPRLGNAGQGINHEHAFETRGDYIRSIMLELSSRLRDVRIACGDWSRVVSKTVTSGLGERCVFLDPPYSADYCGGLYQSDDKSIAKNAAKWAVEHGDDPKMKIALCGYEGEHEMPSDWECFAWRGGGYGAGCGAAGDANRRKERIWFSPGCEVSA